jgi:flagellar biosynthesis component FlhA
MHSALWIIPIMPFVLAFFTTWSFNEAIAEAVWFNATYVIALGIIFGLELAGFGIVSTSPTGLGGFFALLFAFAAMGIRRYQYRQEKKRRDAAKAAAQAEAERQRRRKGNQPQEERSLIVNAIRFAGEVKKSRSNSKR